VALEQDVDIDGKGKFLVSHPGIREDYAEAIQSPPLPIHVQTPAVSLVGLRLDTRLGLVPGNCRYSRLRPDRADVVFDDRVLSRLNPVLESHEEIRAALSG
jgi:hypothetical protein